MNNAAVNSRCRQSLQPSRQFVRQSTRQAALANLPSVIPRVRIKCVVIEPKKPQTTAKNYDCGKLKKPVAPVKRTEPAAPAATCRKRPLMTAALTSDGKRCAGTNREASASLRRRRRCGGKAPRTLAIKASAPSSHYTLHACSSSNYDNLERLRRKRTLKIMWYTRRRVMDNRGMCW